MLLGRALVVKKVRASSGIQSLDAHHDVKRQQPRSPVSRKWSFPVWTAGALLLLIVSGAKLLVVNSTLLRTVDRARDYETIPQYFGDIVGRTALDHSDWRLDDPERSAVIFFPLANSTAVSDLPFWTNIAGQSVGLFPGVQFVGVCDVGDVGSCGALHAGDSIATILSFMSPLQMHSLSIAKRNNQALLYRAPLVTAIPLSDDEQTIVAEVARTLTSGAE